jgi:hypothetical protein
MATFAKLVSSEALLLFGNVKQNGLLLWKHNRSMTFKFASDIHYILVGGGSINKLEPGIESIFVAKLCAVLNFCILINK